MEIIARRQLERRVRAIVDEQGLPEDEAESIVNEALDFGPALDLENFAAMVAETAGRAPTRTAPEEL